MNRERITKINYLLTRTRICSRGGVASEPINKGFIKSLNKIKDYEITNRNISNFS